MALRQQQQALCAQLVGSNLLCLAQIQRRQQRRQCRYAGVVVRVTPAGVGAALHADAGLEEEQASTGDTQVEVLLGGAPDELRGEDRGLLQLILLAQPLDTQDEHLGGGEAGGGGGRGRGGGRGEAGGGGGETGGGAIDEVLRCYGDRVIMIVIHEEIVRR
jgi:hypothetical protein